MAIRKRKEKNLFEQNMPRLSRKQHGFTLIELLLVLALISAISVSAVVFSAPTGASSRLRAAGEEMAALLESVTAVSGMTRIPQVMSFCSGDSGVRIRAVSGTGGDSWIHELPYGVVVAEMWIGQDVREGTTGDIVCHGAGCLEDFTVRLRLQDHSMLVRWDAMETKVLLEPES